MEKSIENDSEEYENKRIYFVECILGILYDLSLIHIYFGIELLPGPVIKEERDISEDVERLLEGFAVDDTYRRFNEIFNPHREVCGDRMVREIISLSRCV